ncbi:hypothetical protein VP01_2242g3 [Puccinia sorghi]|uniref:Uncharacterized protein n=1 Tax=Puccinia sorghi TaxID=27349 RepID=A0A0L6VAE7_9BASI|nr:hypothetical protein VP01_2242g3 [Puccinia sorghi]
MMQNWMEGVLTHHFPECWGFQNLSFKEKRSRGGDPGPNDDYELNQGVFTLKSVVLLSIVGCIPSDLGNSQCGKLKASQWYFLFLFSFHLLFQKSLWETLETSKFIQIDATHGDFFKSEYEKDNQTSIKILKDLKVNPNHHYTLHVRAACYGAQFVELQNGLVNSMSNFKLSGNCVRFRGWKPSILWQNSLLATWKIKQIKREGQLRWMMYCTVGYFVTPVEEIPPSEVIKNYPNPSTHKKAKIPSPKFLIRATWECKSKVWVYMLEPNHCVEIRDNGQVRFEGDG